MCRGVDIGWFENTAQLRVLTSSSSSRRSGSQWHIPCEHSGVVQCLALWSSASVTGV
jgi:hypothetical protein